MKAERRMEKLAPTHRVEDFDCGQPDLNQWLRRYAWQNQGAGAARTYVGLVEERVVGFYSLVVGQVERQDAADRMLKGLARHPVPVMILARLAVDKDWQGRGVGRALLRDAVLRTLQASSIAGIRAFVVHAKDERARQYYEQFDFLPSPTDPLHLMVLLKDIAHTLGV